jgi:cytochrome c oxidase subunit 2
MMRKPVTGILLLTAAGLIAAGLQPEHSAVPVLMRPAAAATPRIVEVRASKYKFSPAEITLRKGETVILRLSSADRTHGFMLKPLKIDTDIAPGAAKDIVVQPDTPGRYTVICDHYCGIGHGNMKMTLIVAR